MLGRLGLLTVRPESAITSILRYAVCPVELMSTSLIVWQDKTVNPSTYKTLAKPSYWGVHVIGEVWAEILWAVLQGLIEKHGYAADLFPPKVLEDGTIPEGDFYSPRTGLKSHLIPKHGNTLMVQ